MEWKQKDGLRWLEAELPGARAAFSTRLGGVSEDGYAELNLGYLTGDSPEAVRTNRHRLAAAIGLAPERIAIGRQVHGARLARHDGPQAPSPFAEPGTCDPPEVDGHFAAADALDAGDRGLGLLVFVADCLPIALAGEGGIAMVHGGWRGLAAGIAGAAAAAVGATAAAVGPGIGPCCFEVGEEVLAAFAPLGPGLADGRMLDLPAVAVRLLERAGVGEVEVSGICTRCEPDLFFSHRGQGPETGRQAGIVWRDA